MHTTKKGLHSYIREYSSNLIHSTSTMDLHINTAQSSIPRMDMTTEPTHKKNRENTMAFRRCSKELRIPRSSSHTWWGWWQTHLLLVDDDWKNIFCHYLSPVTTVELTRLLALNAHVYVSTEKLFVDPFCKFLIARPAYGNATVLWILIVVRIHSCSMETPSQSGTSEELCYLVSCPQSCVLVIASSISSTVEGLRKYINCELHTRRAGVLPRKTRYRWSGASAVSETPFDLVAILSWMLASVRELYL